LRQLAATVLALPVIVVVILGALIRRPAGRLASALAVGAALGLGVVALVPPPPIAATPPSVTRTLPTAEFQVAVAVGQALREPVAIEFGAPMDAASVAQALRIQPPSAVHLMWNDAGTKLTLTPVDHWQPGVLHTVTVAPTATSADGAPLASPLRAVFLTRDEARTAVSATRVFGDRVRLDTAFVVDFERGVDLTQAAAAFRIEPPVPGALVPAGDGEGTGLVFRPAGPLAPGTTYRVSFRGLDRDLDGAPLAALPELVVRTVDAPGVVRFRPRAASDDVLRDQAISVRFTQPMDRRSTGRAFSVTANGAAVDGTIRWAEQDTVLVFAPDAALPYGARVVVAVGEGARSRLGVSLPASASAAFTVEPKPAPVAPRPATRPPATTRAPSTGSSGGSVAGATWVAVERYYLGLMNCTRTGGWVTASGACSSPGGRAVAPLQLDPGISSRVARPYARVLATRGACTHFIGGDPGSRLRRAGYPSYRWAENLGCRSGNPMAAVLGTHLFYQSERPYNGGHYRNLMDPRYDRVGIGVWVSGGQVRLVVNFYRP